MVNCAGAFSQSESEKNFEWIIIIIIDNFFSFFVNSSASTVIKSTYEGEQFMQITSVCILQICSTL